MKLMLFTLGLFGIFLGALLVFTSLAAYMLPGARRPRISLWGAGMLVGGIVLLAVGIPGRGKVMLVR